MSNQEEAQVAQSGKMQGQSKVDIILLKIGKLYRVEREIKMLPARERHIPAEYFTAWLKRGRAKANEIEPYAYLRQFFKELPSLTSLKPCCRRM